MAFQPTRPLRGATRELHAFAQSRKFQPTRPLRGATLVAAVALLEVRISTHAPLAGRDQVLPDAVKENKNISTHAPLAGRDLCSESSCLESLISTHAPLAGRDMIVIISQCHKVGYFNPRAPCGARHRWFHFIIRNIGISTHAPLAGRDHSE